LCSKPSSAPKYYQQPLSFYLSVNSTIFEYKPFNVIITGKAIDTGLTLLQPLKGATQRCLLCVQMLVTLFFLLVFTAASHAQNNTYWQQQVNYRIDVSLNDTAHTLDGFVKMEYTNNSPDTLFFIWFHVWPNAFKNDKTAFSEQLLLNGRTDFYFSKKEERGYINRLDFKVNNSTAATEDHPQYIDVIKLLLPQPLPPQQSITISTPFHVQLPKNFSRGGHIGQSYQITQWYPKPAVYDRKGWHPMPYLDQGEFYSEFGNYDVRITVPENYVVAATGQLQNDAEKKWLLQRANYNWQPEWITIPPATKTKYAKPKKVLKEFPASASATKTLQYTQTHVHDFAWFADKRFIVQQQNVLLPGNKEVLAATYYLPASKNSWKNATSYIAKTLETRSKWLGVYPYATATVVEGPQGFEGGMEYPTITIVNVDSSAAAIESVIEHEVGHNWFYGILASNEREHPWMDEGVNSYYDERYDEAYPHEDAHTSKFVEKRIPKDLESLALRQLYATNKDQPIATASEKFTSYNYGLVAYTKTAAWLQLLEKQLGRTTFDSAMKSYYAQWQFKHPYPEDFKEALENSTRKNLDSNFSLLHKTGALQATAKTKKKIKLISFFSFKDTDKFNYFSFAPVIGYNQYDKLQIGFVRHNYQLPVGRLKFATALMYATGSKKFNVLSNTEYTWRSKGYFRKIDAGFSVAKFTMDEFTPDAGKPILLAFRKLAPFVRLTLHEKDVLSTVTRYIQFRTFLINEDKLSFKTVITPNDTTLEVSKTNATRYLAQLKLGIDNNRALYPYKATLQVEQAANFVRAAFTGNYFFNYANQQGGLNLRVFAGKFFYTGGKTISKQFATDRYHLNMTGPNGAEDYTYSNYFVGRNEFDGLASQQIMMRDGGFKVRTNLLSAKIGKTDNWLAAANFNTSIPAKLNPLSALPVKIPIHFFADIGTYAEAWQKNAATPRFIYDAGLQVSLFAETVNIYFPLFYSAAFKDYFKSTLGDKRFWKQVSFSIDLFNFNQNKIQRTIPLEF
jgi:hypothetical protein